MCGLFASVGFPPDRPCIDVGSQRGPDGEGWREFRSPAGPVAPGQRRMAIIDLSEGSLQPVAGRSHRLPPVFNGEIYNHPELRETLEAQGHIFLTEGDGEVLLAAYRAWGEACLDPLLGKSAFVVWDDARKRMFGIELLYMPANSHGVPFASEIKQLLRLPDTRARINLAEVRDYPASGSSDHTAETMFDGVLRVLPGHCITVDASKGWRWRYGDRRRYARPRYSNLHLSKDDAADRVCELLTDATRMHLRSDVAVGSSLSGGLDSSSIVCLMADMLSLECNGARVNSVSACYSDKSVGEKPLREAAASRTGARPIYVCPRPDDLFDKAGDLASHQDEPFGWSSVFARWSVSRVAREAGIEVMLDGQGADDPRTCRSCCTGRTGTRRRTPSRSGSHSWITGSSSSASLSRTTTRSCAPIRSASCGGRRRSSHPLSPNSATSWSSSLWNRVGSGPDWRHRCCKEWKHHFDPFRRSSTRHRPAASCTRCSIAAARPISPHGASSISGSAASVSGPTLQGSRPMKSSLNSFWTLR